MRLSLAPRCVAPFQAAFLLAMLLAGPAAHGGDRPALRLPAEVAEQRTLQLSPGSGVFPGYTRPRLVKPYTAAGVMMHNGVPIGVVTRQGTTRPVGSFDDRASGRKVDPGFRKGRCSINNLERPLCVRMDARRSSRSGPPRLVTKD